MTTDPTLSGITSLIQTWSEASIAIAPIAQNTRAYNQIVSTYPTLAQNLFNGLTGDTEAAATDTLTSSANYSNLDTITVGFATGGSKVYTLQSTLTNVDGNIKIAVSETLTLANIHHAINGTGGTAGTDYAMATVAHPDVVASDDTIHVVTLTAVMKGVAGNSIVASTTSATAAFAHPTLTGGTGTDTATGLATIIDWRNSLRSVPIEKDDASVAQLDAAMPALNTAWIASFT